MPGPIGGRLALVTGATGGLGEAISPPLASEGARLALPGRRADGLDALARALGATTHPRDFAGARHRRGEARPGRAASPPPPRVWAARRALSPPPEGPAGVHAPVSRGGRPGPGPPDPSGEGELARGLAATPGAPILLARAAGTA